MTSQNVVKKKVVIKNKNGLHARPATMFVQIANKYDSEITITKNEESVNGKSIMGILLLAAQCGQELEISAAGADAPQAVEALEQLLLINDV